VSTVDLSSECVEAIARRVAELQGSQPGREQLLDASQVADRFRVSRYYVYEHADELGAIRLGDGPKARLRFDPEHVTDALTPRPKPREPKRSKPRRRTPSGGLGGGLLPIKGHER
jgi:hypothetical protein